MRKPPIARQTPGHANDTGSTNTESISSAPPLVQPEVSYLVATLRMVARQLRGEMVPAEDIADTLCLLADTMEASHED